MRLLARTEGIFAETAGGVTIATLQAARRARASSAPTSGSSRTSPVTGSRRSTRCAEQVGPTATIAPTLDAFHAAFDPSTFDQ